MAISNLTIKDDRDPLKFFSFNNYIHFRQKLLLPDINQSRYGIKTRNNHDVG